MEQPTAYPAVLLRAISPTGRRHRLAGLHGDKKGVAVTSRTATGRLALLRRMGAGLAVLALAIGMAATAAGPANASTPPGSGGANSQAAAPKHSTVSTGSPVGTAATVAAVAPSAAVSSVPSGSIVYIYGGNVWLMAADGSAKVQITHDGTGAAPYYSPSESDDGTIVAIRNTTSGATYGVIYLMNRDGRLITTYTPVQYAPHGTPDNCVSDYQVAPNGLQRASISPDGTRIAYTATALFQPYGCGGVSNVYKSYVIGRAGAGAVALANVYSADASEVGGWGDNATILMSNQLFDHTSIYRVSVPANTATLWVSDNDEWDSAFEGPSRGASILATDGWSDSAGSNVVRIWNSPSLTATPAVRCEIPATAGQSNSSVYGTAGAWPVSAQPGGNSVAWWEYNGDSSLRTPDEGVYVTTMPSTGCPTTKTLIASGGSDPFWGKAAVDAPVAVDTAPVVKVTVKPAAYVRSTSASISFTVTDTTDYSVAKACTLDGKATACTSPRALTGLAQGKHTFVITATDPLGAKGTATVTWVADTVLPTIGVSAPAAVTFGTSVAFHWAGKDAVSGVASYDVEYAYAPYTGNFTAWTVKLAGTKSPSWTVSGLRPGYVYCVRVRAHDRAGNVSAYSAARCTTRPLDDRSLHSSAYWSKPTVTAAYLHTETDAAHTGATLTLANARVSRLAVLATVSTAGGSVAVYVGTVKIGTVSLKASAGHSQQLLWLPAVSARTGTVTLKTLSIASVRIDGLVDARTP